MKPRKASSSVIIGSTASRAEQRKWQAEDALRTMTRAEEIRRDSALMRDVKKLAAEQQKMLGNVANSGVKASRTAKKE